MNTEKNIEQLYERYINATATREELSELFALADQPGNEAIFEKLLSASWDEIQHTGWQLDQIRSGIAKEKPVKQPLSFLRGWMRVAAILIVVTLTAYLLWFRQSQQLMVTHTVATQNDIVPGSNKAIWVQTDGKQVELDSTVLDMTAKKEQANETGFNELRTPRGGQYQLILPDGSKLWLNAASSVKYPVVFNGKERRVEVTGEAYFEIAKDASKPFKVNADGQEIEVLGTSFNINVYNDEPIKKTTLTTGSIKITHNNQTAILQPGQQANIPILSILPIRLIQVQTDEVIAWKNGYFSFKNAGIKDVMRQLEKWYDIDVLYEGAANVDGQRFSGEIGRSLALKEVLDVLMMARVEYRLEGRRLIVTLRNAN